jgi:hypothetical protein
LMAGVADGRRQTAVYMPKAGRHAHNQ